MLNHGAKGFSRIQYASAAYRDDPINMPSPAGDPAINIRREASWLTIS